MLNIMDVSASLRLGGAFVTQLRAPVPSGLVLHVAAQILPPPAAVPGGFVPPVNTKFSAAAVNPANYLTW
jgi:hypothetical protein